MIKKYTVIWSKFQSLNNFYLGQNILDITVLKNNNNVKP